MSLKTKLIIAYGGLIAILAVVGALTIRTINESGKAIDKILHENYDSIVACYKMQDSLERLDRLAEISLCQKVSDLTSQIQSNKQDFENNLKFQQNNITVPGEREITDQLTTLWQEYRREMEQFLSNFKCQPALFRNIPPSPLTKVSRSPGGDTKNSGIELTEYGIGGWTVASKGDPDKKCHIISFVHRHRRSLGIYCAGYTVNFRTHCQPDQVSA